jgi:hypothetical protein
MKLFILFLVLCLLIGILPRMQMRKRVLMVIGLCFMVCIGYYFFHQI